MHESPLGRGISDYFHCFTCDAAVWDCDHLIDDRLQADERLYAFEPSSLQSFVYDSNQRTFTFDDYVARLPIEERQTLVVTVALMKVLLLRMLAPRRVAGLGGLL